MAQKPRHLRERLELYQESHPVSRAGQPTCLVTLPCHLSVSQLTHPHATDRPFASSRAAARACSSAAMISSGLGTFLEKVTTTRAPSPRRARSLVPVRGLPGFLAGLAAGSSTACSFVATALMLPATSTAVGAFS